MKSVLVGLFFSVTVFACHQRGTNSETESTDMVTIRVENSDVAQPILFASVTGEAECRGGAPKYYVPKPNSDWQPGKPLPELKVDLTVRRVCIAGQPGAAAGGGQDIKYWNLPKNLKGGSILVIRGKDISVSLEEDQRNNGSSAELTCDSYGAKLVVSKSGDKYVATITGKAAQLFRDEQGKTVLATGGGYDAGRTIETTKKFPKHWTLSNNFDQLSEAPQVTIKGLSKSELGYAADQHGPVIQKEETGYKLTLTFFELTGSHTSLKYEYANWFFEAKDCK